MHKKITLFFRFASGYNPLSDYLSVAHCKRTAVGQVIINFIAVNVLKMSAV